MGVFGENCMRNLNVRALGLGLIAGAAMIASSAAFAGIVGTMHDWSTTGAAGQGQSLGATPGDQVCVVCHAPHGTAGAGTLLWNRTYSGGSSYVMYGAASAGLAGTTAAGTATNTTPGSVSILCLSCHDGTVGLEQYAGNSTGTTVMTGAAAIGVDLNQEHPIGVPYTAGAGFNPTTTSFGATNTIADVLVGGDVECNTCHDVHDSEALAERFLRVTLAQSAICTACHIK